MFSSLIESIKADKELSYSHWRYRLLHWFFNVDPTNEEERTNTVPSFMYSHYCPLFHFTNLVAIFSPVILTWKIIWFLGSLLFSLIAFLLEKGKAGTEVVLGSAAAQSFFTWCDSIFKAAFKKRERRVNKEYLLSLIPYYIEFDYKRSTNGDYRSFGHFWLWYCQSMGDPLYGLEEKETEEIWKVELPLFEARLETLKAQQAAREALKKAAAEKRKAWIIFWVNFSQGFVKWGLNGLYLVLTFAVAYGVGWFSINVIPGLAADLWAFLVWSWESTMKFDLWAALNFTLHWGLGITAVATVIGVFARLTVAYHQVVGHHLTRFFSLFSFLLIFPKAIGAFLGMCLDTVESFLDFCKEFYSESCPKITIIDEVEQE